MLNRIDANMLGYAYAIDNNKEAQAFLDKLRLTPEMLRGIRLSQSLVTGERIVFSADGTAELELGYWPALLRGTEFTAEHQAVEDANTRT